MKDAILSFESISETGANSIIGGFSLSFFTNSEESGSDGTTNNCIGGNCLDICGSGQNIKCNTVAGCHG
ncbi:hypothetical protein [Pedobacter jeongneungensis]